MIETFEELLKVSQATIPVFGFILNMLLSAVLATLLGWLYSRYGESLSNRKQAGKNFLLITLTTMLIISVVKSSLALSLGLVGALSIIRFRAAIKEPEELSYLFLAIAVGLGFGADQTIITLVAFSIIAILIIIAKKFSKKYENDQNLHLTIQSENRKNISIDTILGVLENNIDEVDLRRLDETKDHIEASFIVGSQNFTQLNKAKVELQNLDDNLKITFLDNKGLL